MGLGGISIWQLLIILVIVLLLFGTKKLRGMGGDLGSAIKSFRKSMKEESADDEKTEQLEEQAEAGEKLTEETEPPAEEEIATAHKEKA